MRNRGSAIIIEHQKVVLIKRNRNNCVYYVFPGGGIEEGETPEQTTKREAFEELGVKINVKECIEKVEFNGMQYFFLSEIIEGEVGSGEGEEYTEISRDRGTYQPIWMEIKQLSSIDIRPKEVAVKIQSLLN
ncbi:NUDIX domain-containing protein [Bacillus sp. EAC]|uniref:NUDIX hydrolase n=1 Tax=Bacillus sp. EAC TaxID=1978338 RepID=UPI000B4415CC|nr:NUDIX domain-containing protein [Bacillus sp. EAC]